MEACISEAPQKPRKMSSKVLIVEDDSDTVKLVDLYLRLDGHKVLRANLGHREQQL